MTLCDKVGKLPRYLKMTSKTVYALWTTSHLEALYERPLTWKRFMDDLSPGSALWMAPYLECGESFLDGQTDGGHEYDVGQTDVSHDGASHQPV